MLKHPLGLGVSVALLLTLFAGSTLAQQVPPTPAASSSDQCGGQYECVEDRPLTPAEAQASRSHPQNGQEPVPPQDPREVAATRPTTTK